MNVTQDRVKKNFFALQTQMLVVFEHSCLPIIAEALQTIFFSMMMKVVVPLPVYLHYPYFHQYSYCTSHV